MTNIIIRSLEQIWADADPIYERMVRREEEQKHDVLAFGVLVAEAMAQIPHGEQETTLLSRYPMLARSQLYKYKRIGENAETVKKIEGPVTVKGALRTISQMSPGRQAPKAPSWPTIQKKAAEGVPLSAYEIQTKVLKIIGKAKIADEVDAELGSLAQYDQTQLDGMHAVAREAMNKWSKIAERLRSVSQTNLRIVRD